MKKRNEFDEFLRLLEEAIYGMIDKMNLPDDKPVNIEISLNMCPHMFASSRIVAEPATKTPVDILETEKNIHAIVALPGIKEEKIQLACSGTELEIKADNDGTVSEVVNLPARVNKTGIKATYKNGILEVIFNKRKTRKRPN